MEMDIDQFEPIVGEENLDWDKVERKHLHEDDGRVPHVPFGFNNANWVKFKAQRTDSTELRSFSSSTEDWEKGMGSEGYVLIANEKIVACIVTIMN